MKLPRIRIDFGTFLYGLAALFLVAFVLVLGRRCTPEPNHLPPPTDSDTVRVSRPFRAEPIAPKERIVPAKVVLHTQPDTALRDTLATQPRQVEVEITKDAIRIATIDKHGLVEVKTYELAGQIEMPTIERLVIDGSGNLKAIRKSKRKLWWARNKKTFTRTALVLGAGLLVGGTAYTTYHFTR